MEFPAPADQDRIAVTYCSGSPNLGLANTNKAAASIAADWLQ